MKTLGLVAVILGLAGCGDSGGSGGAGGVSGEGGVLTPAGGSGSVDDAVICSNACAEIVPLGCANGPPNQAECENGCGVIRSGPCREAHDALLACAGDDPSYACNENDAVSVTGCDNENAALNDCLASM